MKNIRSILDRKFYFVTAMIFNFLFALIVIQYAEMFRIFFDNAQTGVTSNYLSNFLLLLFFISLQTLFHFIASMCINKLYLLNKRKLQKEFFDSVMDRDIKHINEYSTGKLQNIIMSDIDDIAKLLSFTTLKAIHIVMETILFIIYLFTIDILLGIVSLMISPILLLFGMLFSKVLRRSSTDYSIHEASLSTKYNDFFQYNMFFKLFESNNYLNTQVNKAVNDYNKVAKRAFMISTLFNELSSGIGQAANITVLAIGAYMISKNSLTTGELVAFMQIQNQIVWPLVSLNSLYGKYQNSKGKQDIVDQILTLEPQNNELILKDELKSLFEFKNVSVALKDKVVLKHVDFSVNENEMVLIMGENGVGKSTLVNTLFGLYSPDEGEVNYNTTLATTINNEAIEYCIQQTTIIEGTLRSNICLDQDIDDLLIIMMCDKFKLLNDFSDGLDSHIQFSGRNISGGQSRKISLIRSLLSKKPILILDEPFAALDAMSVHILVELLNEIKKVKTILVISHSNELFELSDKVLFFASTGLVSSSYNDLKSKNDEFNNFLSHNMA